VAALPFKVLAGVPSTSRVPIVVLCKVSGDVTITLNSGQNITISPVVFGNDRSVADPGGQTNAGWAGDGAFTGLSAFTRYTYTATQGSNTQTGSFMTAPLENTKFWLSAGGCDNNTGLTNQGDTEDASKLATISGSYPLIEAKIKARPNDYLGFLFLEDIFGYLDGWGGVLGIDDSLGTGRKMDLDGSGNFIVNQYNYALSYMASMGLLEYDKVIGSNYESCKSIKWGWDESRNYVHANSNIYPAKGDHDVYGDYGFAIPYADPSIAVYVAASNATWAQVVRPLYSDNILNASNSECYSVTLGDIEFCAPDGFTNGTGTVSTYQVPQTQITSLFGSGQIDDILTRMQSSTAKHKILDLPYSIKYMDASQHSEFNDGAQHPLKDHVPLEFAQLFTASGNTPPSLMDLSATNGLTGTLAIVKSDFHHAQVTMHESNSGDIAEHILELNMGTINGSLNFAQDSSIIKGAVFDGSTIEYSQQEDVGSGPTARQFYYVFIENRPSTRPEIYFDLIHGNSGVSKWSGSQFVGFGRNTVKNTLQNTGALEELL